MTAIISAIADGSSVIYRGRAFISALADTVRMNDSWRTRLLEVIGDRSMREVSLAAGLNPGYVQSILNGKDPGFTRLQKICAAIEASPTYIMYGVDVKPEDAEVLEAMNSDPSTRDAVLILLRNRRAS